MEGEDTARFHPGMMKTYIDKRVNVKIAPLGLTSSNVLFLMAVRRKEGISLKELTAYIMVDKALTTRTVRQLIDKGLIENRGTGREYSLFLTDSGRETESKVRKAYRESHVEMLDCLTPEERVEINRILGKIMKKLGDEACR